MTSHDPLGDQVRWPDGLHPATKNLVRTFATALAWKLRKAEMKYGYADSWRESDWSEECRGKMMGHIAKGDPLDVAAYCAFMWWHQWSCTPRVARKRGRRKPR